MSAERIYFDLDCGELLVWYEPSTGQAGWSPPRRSAEWVVGLLGREIGKRQARIDWMQRAMKAIAEGVTLDVPEAP